MQHARQDGKWWGKAVKATGVSWSVALVSPDGCGQASSEAIKRVLHSFLEMFQNHESDLTYLQKHRVSDTIVSLHISKQINQWCNVEWCPLEGALIQQDQWLSQNDFLENPLRPYHVS